MKTVKKMRVLVVDEDGEVVFHGPVSSFDVRQDYDRYFSACYEGPMQYLARPATAQISCTHVQTGLPAPAPVQGGGRPHNFDPITGLSRKCKDCGYRETLAAAMFGHQAPACPGPVNRIASGLVPSKGPHTWYVLKTRAPGPGPAIVPGKACECGSAKAGLPTHSSWCPAAKP